MDNLARNQQKMSCCVLQCVTEGSDGKEVFAGRDGEAGPEIRFTVMQLKHNETSLALLDLSAAFDTVDQAV